MLPVFPPSFSWDICFVTSWQWRQLLWKTHKGARMSEHNSSRQLRVFTKWLQFSRRQCKQTKEERDVSTTSSLKFPITNEVTLGWLSKEQKKYCSAGMSAYCHHDTTREAGEAFVRWTHFALTEHNLKVGDCVSAGRAFTFTRFLLQNLQAWVVQFSQDTLIRKSEACANTVMLL